MTTANGKILIADNDDLFRCTIAEVLEREGYICASVSETSSVVELITQEQFDLLIVDIELPGNTRLELLPRLAEKVPHLPVLVVTGHPSLHTALRAIQLRVAAYLVKPFEVKELLIEVREALAGNRLTNTLLSLRNRWQDWSVELRDSAEAIPLRLERNELLLESLVDVSLRNLARCFADLQDLQRALKEERLPLVSGPSESVETSNGANASDSSQRMPAFSSSSRWVTSERMNLPVELQDRLRQLSRREREVLRLLLANQRPQAIAETLFISPYTVRNHLRSIFDKLAVRSQAELFARLGQHAAYMDILRIV